MVRVNRTIKTANAAFSNSVNCTSIDLNSTRHPMVELTGGGLKRMVCQLVDWMFCLSEEYKRMELVWIIKITYFKIIGRFLIVLIQKLVVNYKRVAYEQMRHMLGEDSINSCLNKRLESTQQQTWKLNEMILTVCQKFLINWFIKFQRNIIVFFKMGWIERQKRVDRIITRLGDRRRRWWLGCGEWGILQK